MNNSVNMSLFDSNIFTILRMNFKNGNFVFVPRIDSLIKHRITNEQFVFGIIRSN
jgi:hypothetical protein